MSTHQDKSKYSNDFEEWRAKQRKERDEERAEYQRQVDAGEDDPYMPMPPISTRPMKSVFIGPAVCGDCFATADEDPGDCTWSFHRRSPETLPSESGSKLAGGHDVQ